jgi:hypothetical protein
MCVNPTQVYVNPTHVCVNPTKVAGAAHDALLVSAQPPSTPQGAALQRAITAAAEALVAMESDLTRWVLRARWVTLRARWVTLRARWVTLRARWVTLRAHWVTLRAGWVTL